MGKLLRVLARVIMHDGERILLVRNRQGDFWYPPGGGWEHNTETIRECAVREVREETGYGVEIQRLAWVQEFHESAQQCFLRRFGWR